MKNMVAPTFRSAGAELKLSATTRHQPAKVSQAGPKARKPSFSQVDTKSVLGREREK
jgi:hypothetical protein